MALRLTLATLLLVTLGTASAQDLRGSSSQPPAGGSPAAPPTSAPAPDARKAGEAAKRRHDIDERAQAALDKLFAQHPAARKLFDQAAGYAAFRGTKAGFLFVTGGGGTGVAVDKGTGNRTYMRMGAGGVGVGFGAQTYDLVIFFQTKGQLARFAAGGWDATTAAQAAAGQAGAAAASSFVGGVAMFYLTNKGLMAQADISGTRFWPAAELNPK